MPGQVLGVDARLAAVWKFSAPAPNYTVDHSGRGLSGSVRTSPK